MTAPYFEPPPPPQPEPSAVDALLEASTASDASALAGAARKKSHVGRWLFLIAMLGIGAAGFYGYTKKQPLELWARVYDLSKGRFPNWTEFKEATKEDASNEQGAKPASPAKQQDDAKEAADSEESREETSDDAQPSEKSEEADEGNAKQAVDDEKQQKEAKKSEKKVRDKDRETSDLKQPEEEKKPSEESGEAEAASDLPPFDRSAAAQALGSIASSVGSCKQPDGPTGSGRATVTFASSGRATNATVSGSFAGTAVGGCIARLFRNARVPAFSGGSVTVAKRFSVD